MIINKKLVASVLFLALAAFTAALYLAPSVWAPAAEGAKLEQMVLNYAWIPEGYHSYFFLARKKGYYADKGIDLILRQGKGSAATLPLVAQGSQHFGFIDASVVLKGIAAGMPIKMVALLQQRSPFTLITLEGLGIEKLKDFEGRSIGDVPGGACQQHMKNLLKINGINLDKVKFVVTNPEAQINLLVTKKIDGFCGWHSGQVVTLDIQGKKEGYKPKSFLYADHGINLISSGIVTSSALIEKKPELVRSFVEASLKGLADAIKNPKEATDALIEVFPELDHEIELGKLVRTADLLKSKYTEGKCLGWQTKEQWQELVKRNKEVGAIETEVDVDKAFTNDFLPCK